MDDLHSALRLKNVEVLSCTALQQRQPHTLPSTLHVLSAQELVMIIICRVCPASLQPMYSFASSTDRARFVRAAGHPDVAFLHDQELSFEQVRIFASDSQALLSMSPDDESFPLVWS